MNSGGRSGRSSQRSEKNQSPRKGKVSPEGRPDRKPYNRDSKPRFGAPKADGTQDGRTERKPYNRDPKPRFGAPKNDGAQDGRTERKPYNRDPKPRFGAPKNDGTQDGRTERKPYNRDPKPRFGAPKADGAQDGRPERKTYNQDSKSRFGAPKADGTQDGRTERKSYNRDPKPRFGAPKADGTQESKSYRKPVKRDVDFDEPIENYSEEAKPERSTFSKDYKPRYSGPRKPYKSKNKAKEKEPGDLSQRLNKFLSNAGICSRREADILIASGVIKVNGEIVSELGYKVSPSDLVHVHDRKVSGEPPVYVLLNKPKDFLTTTKDPRNRKTVMELVSGLTNYRIFPVGRLDRLTTGVLLLTNDGPLAEKLMHPSFGIEKIYHVELDQKFTSSDMDALQRGFDLSDGFIKPDEAEWVVGLDKKHVGIKLHSGRNRIVRRIFEHLGYKVVKLDRVLYAGLSKKGLSRGQCRMLNEQEIRALKQLN